MCGVNCLFLEALKEIKRESKVHIRSSTLTFVLDEGDNPSWGESTTRFSSTIVGPIERSTIPVIKAPSSISEDGGTRSSTGSSDAGSRVTVTHHSRTASFASPMELHRHSNTFMGDTYSPNKSSASGSPENNHTSPSQRATSFHLDLNSLQPPQGNSRCSSASASATVLGPSGGQMALLISLDSWRAKTAPGTIFHGTKQDISQLAKLGSQGNLFNRWTGSSTTVSSRRSDNPFTRKKDAFDHCAVPDAVKFKYKLVYEVYCRVGAPCELNLPHKLRLELKDLAENGKFCVGSYEEARAHVIHLLFSNIYARWACQHLEQGNSYDLTNGTLIKRHSFWLPPPRTNSPLK
ncbi:hypothetical protein BC830DRAFT_80838 [Chytriomyces sp. MP71]|nr:hypothetical protein BC830DRAFT_80838 [Chytriomyces sp. MP71]